MRPSEIVGAGLALGLGLLCLGAACALALAGRISEDEDELLAAEIEKLARERRRAPRPFIREHVIEYGQVSKDDMVRVLERA